MHREVYQNVYCTSLFASESAATHARICSYPVVWLSISNWRVGSNSFTGISDSKPEFKASDGSLGLHKTLSRCICSSLEAIVSLNIGTAGWGANSGGGPPSPVLRGLDMFLLPREVGNTTLAVQNDTLQQNQLIAFSQSGSTCQGDSGGPLLYSVCKASLLN